MFELQMANSEWALAYFILEWILRLAFIALILPSRQPAAARTWLLFGFLTPVPAVIVYALIGRVRNPRLRMEREKRAASARMQWLEGLARNQAAMSALNQFVAKIGANPTSTGNAIRLLTDYDKTVDDLVKAIDAAQYRVRLLTYILANDPVGQRIINALCRAQARGVAVHVMFDAFGSSRWRKAVLAELQKASIPARACNHYNPFAGGTGRLDRRNHRKIYAIDDRLAFIGSQNLISRDFRPGIINHELMVRIEGPLAAELSMQFVSDWIADGGGPVGLPDFPVISSGNANGQLLASEPDQHVSTYTLLLSHMLQEARHSVLIVSPYTVLDEGLQLAVRTASLRGVSVTLLVSAIVDQPLVHLAQEAGYASLLATGITIREFKAGLLHAKYVLVDGIYTIIGSCNADIRSFQINSEISLVSEDPVLAKDLAAVAQEHLAQSRDVEPRQWAARPIYRRALQRIAALASPLL